MLREINSAIEVETVQSAKFFIKIFDGKSFKHQIIFRKSNGVSFNTELSNEIKMMSRWAKEVINVGKQPIEFSWVALLKDEDGHFYQAKGKYDSQEGEKSTSHSFIFAHTVIEFCNDTLKDMDMKVKPQLDNQLEFI
jgi:hypothetical protein